MKLSIAFLTVLICVFCLQSCFVRALHPFYTEEKLVFDPIFNGKWLDQEGGSWEVSQYKKSKRFMGPESLYQAYSVRISDQDREDTFLVHMFQIGSDTYLDFIPFIEEDYNTDIYIAHIFTTHSLAKFYKQTDSLVYVKWFNEEWLKELFKQKRIKIAHEIVDQESYILTADTEALQKFILKYGNDPNAFKSPWEGLPEDQDDEDFTMILKKSNEISY